MSTWTIHPGDTRASLAKLPERLARCCVTSPPYWGLRDYGHGGQIGLEASPAAYVAAMVEVFAAVRRVLTDDGTVWLNLGDSYTGNASTGGTGKSTAYVVRDLPDKNTPGLKPKDLVGIPWRVAFALQADGWYLRSDIIWSKNNPMPESVTDRPTKSHEYLFLFGKGQRVSRVVQIADAPGDRFHLGKHLSGQSPVSSKPLTKCCIALATAIFDSTQREHDFSLPPFYAKEWHEAANGDSGSLVRCHPCKRGLAALSAGFLNADITAKEFLQKMDRFWLDLGNRDALLVGGALAPLLSPPIHVDADGAVTVNHSGEVCKFRFGHGEIVVERPTTCNYFYDADAIREPFATESREGERSSYKPGSASSMNGGEHQAKGGSFVGLPLNELGRNKRDVWTIPTQPYSGAHFATYPEALVEPCILAGSAVGDTVLDPFSGSGTTGAVAVRHGRNYIGCELNPAYIALSEKRIGAEAPLFTKGAVA